MSDRHAPSNTKDKNYKYTTKHHAFVTNFLRNRETFREMFKLVAYIILSSEYLYPVQWCLPRVAGVGGLCVFHDVTARQAPAGWYPQTAEGWSHYHRSCLTVFASSRVWYNLLCNTDLDCPDPYSQCVSGRCLCPRGTHYNQTENACVPARKSQVVELWAVLTAFLQNVNCQLVCSYSKSN